MSGQFLGERCGPIWRKELGRIDDSAGERRHVQGKSQFRQGYCCQNNQRRNFPRPDSLGTEGIAPS